MPGTNSSDLADAVARPVVVVIGGDPLQPDAAAASPPGAFVIAADSGLDHALAAGISPDLVVGDLDSVSVAGLAIARDRGIPIEQHPPEKDATDTELALATALARGATDIVVLSGGGDRLDHSISAITALGHTSLARCSSVTAHWGDSTVHVLHGPRELDVTLAPGATFSLLALQGTCTGVAVTGARWPLHEATIEPGSSLGISNLAARPTVTVTVGRGVLSVIVPHHVAAPAHSPASAPTPSEEPS